VEVMVPLGASEERSLSTLIKEERVVEGI